MTRALVTKMLRALDASRDDVNECLNEVLPKAGSYRYDRVIDSLTTKLTKHDAAITAARDYLATEPSGERAKVAERLRCIGRLVSYSDVYTKAADMLEADAQQVSNLLARIHRDGGHYESEHGRSKAINTADLIVAKLNAMDDAQQAKRVPMSDERIEEEWYSTSSDQAFYDFVNGVRLAEKHHGIGVRNDPPPPQQAKPTDWSAA